jgi:hypothetical protein
MTKSTEDDDVRITQAELLRELLVRVGYAVWQAAECEDTLAHYVVLRLRSVRGVGDKIGHEVLSSAQGRTFGNLLKELREATVLPSDLEGRLSKLVNERNWMVHRAKRESRGVLNDMEKLDTLIARLDAVAAEATEINSVLEHELEEFVVSAGLDRARIDAEAAALVRQWGY